MTKGIHRALLACVVYLGLLSVPAPSYALDCSVTAMQFYTEAKRKGWKFDCINNAFPSLLAVRPTFIPKPPNQIACVAKLNAKSEMIMFLFAPQSSHTMETRFLFDGWFLDGVPRHSLINNKNVPPVTTKQHVTSRNINFSGTFPDGKTSMIVLDKFVLRAPRGKTCNDWKGAVDPRRP